MTCTTIDHCYPQNAPDRKTAPGTSCFCGQRAWGGGKVRRVAKSVKVGALVRIVGTTEERTVVERVRSDGETLYRTDGAPVGGRKLWEVTEVEPL